MCDILRRYFLYLWVVVVFVASELLAAWLGIHFASGTLGRLYQYLDPRILREDLLRGLYFLHAQPPLFNLGLGLGLQVFPESYPRVFSYLFGAMALGLLFGMAWLMRRSEIPDGISAFVLALFALSPSFAVYRYWLFYTLPVAFELVVAAIGLSLFLERERRAGLVLFAAATTAVMMTRSVFHPLWLVATCVVLLPFIRARRKFLVACLVPFVIVNLWFLKNYTLVGSYAGSTWLGLSLTKRWPLSQKEIAELKSRGALPEFWQRRPFQEPSTFEPFGFFRDGERIHPALDAPYKSNGEPNFNHRDYVAISGAMLEGDRYLIRHYPARYFRRVVTALLLFLQPGPNSVHFLVDYDFDRVHRYRDAWTRYLFRGGRVERPIRMFAPPANLWLVLFPVLLLAGARAVWRGRGLYAFLLLTVLWVTAVTSLIEIGENDRMRWEVEPFLAILLAYALSRLSRRKKEVPPV